jgi:hypothetical protein
MSRQPQDREPDRDAMTTPRSRSAGRRRALGVAFSVACHLLILLVVVSVPATQTRLPDPVPVNVQLIDGEKLFAPEAPPAPAKKPAPPKAKTPTKARTPKKTAARVHLRLPPAPVKAPARRSLARLSPPRPDVEAMPVAVAPPAGSEPGLSDAQLAGATSAEGGGGGGGGDCDMAGRLQAVLRKDRLVHAAVANYAGKAVMVWDGEWIWFRGDIGKGLTAVRQAMAWEIAFAPQACRSRLMHGLVVFSLNGAQGPVRLAVGHGEWRWSDMLKAEP